MAYRDLTLRFNERRQNLKKRNLRFQLRHIKESPTYLALFQSKQTRVDMIVDAMPFDTLTQQQMKSRVMEKALLQEAIECENLERGDPVQKPEWTYFADEANEAIRLLHVKLEYLQLIHTRRLMIRFDGAEEEQEQEIDAITADITALFQSADRNLKKIMSLFIGGVPCTSATDRLVCVNTQRSIASRLQEISYQFRKRQHEYLQRLQVQKFGCDIFDVDELESAKNDDDEFGCSQKFDIVFEMQRFKIKSRDEEIRRIAKSVAMLATIFKEVADMVIDQGTLIDRIDYNMEQVVCRMRTGLKELHRAERHQRNTRPERCIFILVSLILLCFLILLVKHSVVFIHLIGDWVFPPSTIRADIRPLHVRRLKLWSSYHPLPVITSPQQQTATCKAPHNAIRTLARHRKRRTSISISISFSTKPSPSPSPQAQEQAMSPRGASKSAAEPAAKKARAASSSSMSSAWEELAYLPGFGGHFCSETLPGALPKAQNNPQKCPYGLYAEQLSGTAFTLPRDKNQRSWLYRILPPVVHEKYKEVEHKFLQNDFANATLTPQQMRWSPMPFPEESEKLDFVDGIKTVGGAGDPTLKDGMAIHNYAANVSMTDKCFYNSDGDFLIVPQHGVLKITTEFGKLLVSPHEICVIQRGIRFSVDIDEPVRGYILEVYNRHFVLPDLGPIGANGLANPRDFEHPVAAWEDRECEYLVVNKFGGRVFSARMTFSPFNVVAWHGNYVPYKYNLDNFCTMNSVSFDHPDPSIYTVLTCQTDEPGCAVADFVIFPPRWMVMEHTFRPPYFHRNCMTEYMGMIYGTYDAKKGGKDGFQPGGASLHSVDTPHGPDAATFLAASNADLAPHKFEGGLAFMFESTFLVKLTDYSLNCEHNDADYWKCWQKMPKLFNPDQI